MGRNDARRATDAELEILNVLWNRGDCTVREVHDDLSRLRDIGYTTTLKAFQVMTKKGLVRRDSSARAHVYQAAVDREKTQREHVGDLLDRLFSGSAAGLVARALSARKTSPEDLAQIRQLLDKAEGR